MYYMGFSFVECYNIPIWQRRWFITRLNEEIKKSRDGDGATRAAHQNDAGTREMMGRQRSQVPAKLRRFT
ncbi:MAG: hypothetical protein CBC29_07365 [Methylococcaceae bacterium TMED69]|nr:MAG: hypothetical protein CBC29_05545 [Methylococcaceae bacterium TMED69]OUU74939.1 MAG: hypothetical protein CBC29_07365 [Methylococcaceae bacterium TMED69]